MKDKLKGVYYGGLDPRSRITSIAKKYALYFDELHVVNSLKLLELYKKPLSEIGKYSTIADKYKTVMSEINEFSEATGFTVSFYDPIETSNAKLWKLVIETTENDLREARMTQEALKTFQPNHIAEGMITGINIALAKSIELSSAPITNELALHELAMKKVNVALAKFQESDLLPKKLGQRFFLSKEQITNLYGFEILNRLPLPVGELSERKIAELRGSPKFENFRNNLINKSRECVERATDILNLDQELIPLKVQKLKKDLRGYEKTVKEEIPKLRSEFRRNLVRNSVSIGLLTAIAFGAPLGLVCFSAATILEYLYGYYEPKEDLLSRHDSCCAFLFDLGGIVELKRQRRHLSSLLPKMDIGSAKERYGFEASLAALYLEDFE